LREPSGQQQLLPALCTVDVAAGRFAHRSGEMLQRLASLVDDAVYCEPISSSEFPVKHFSAHFEADDIHKAAEMLGFFTKFPEEWNRELFFVIREFQKGYQGIFGAVQGNTSFVSNV
jgi:hypothetical protein